MGEWRVDLPRVPLSPRSRRRILTLPTDLINPSGRITTDYVTSAASFASFPILLPIDLEQISRGEYGEINTEKGTKN